MLGIPYMGSKRKLAKPIVDYILQNNPNTKYVYDLFGGGGAISFQFLKKKQIKKVVYNEFNTGVCELLRDIQKNGVTEKYYKWVDRETFDKHKNDDDWFGGLVKCVWSFGNNQRDYLFSPKNEKLKKSLHNIIVDKCKASIKEVHDNYHITIDERLLDVDNISKRRLNVMAVVKKSIKGRCELQRLEQLEQLEQLQRLEIHNQSYEQVLIETPINETIIYLDPPYYKTAKYQKAIDYEALFEYIRNSPYKIYISSYQMPFEECAQFEHMCSIAATKSQKVTERLFCNQKEIYKGRLF